jgi:hypothetical protein
MLARNVSTLARSASEPVETTTVARGAGRHHGRDGALITPSCASIVVLSAYCRSLHDGAVGEIDDEAHDVADLLVGGAIGLPPGPAADRRACR